MISEGDIVEFSIEKGKDGRREAVDVTCLAGREIHVAASTARGGGPPRGRRRWGSGGSCYNCGQGGHLARDCRQSSEGRGVERKVERGIGRGVGRGVERGVVGGVGVVGGGGGSGVVCYNCRQLGHLARNCSQISGPGRQGFRGSCYNCGQSGHLARDCNQESGSLVKTSIRGYSGGGRGCYNCGEQSHVATDCPNNND